jgi:hypothetical protein
MVSRNRKGLHVDSSVRLDHTEMYVILRNRIVQVLLTLISTRATTMRRASLALPGYYFSCTCGISAFFGAIIYIPVQQCLFRPGEGHALAHIDKHVRDLCRSTAASKTAHIFPRQRSSITLYACAEEQRIKVCELVSFFSVAVFHLPKNLLSANAEQCHFVLLIRRICKRETVEIRHPLK